VSAAEVLTKVPTLSSPVGLVAGSGSYPLEFIKNAKARGLDVVVVAHVGEADPAVATQALHCEWIKVGELGKIISVFQAHKVKHAALAGGISRPKLFGGVKLDLRALSLLARTRSVKDDILLRAVADELRKEGIEVISASVLLSNCVPSSGYLSKRKLSQEEREDLVIGWEAARTLGALDIGQTVVVSKGMVVAIEAIEGTDGTIKRAGELAGTGCVVVKLAKPQQDLRLDLPAIGSKTIETMQAAKAAALVVETGKCLILERDEVVRLADRAGIAIVALSDPEEIESVT